MMGNADEGAGAGGAEPVVEGARVWAVAAGGAPSSNRATGGAAARSCAFASTAEKASATQASANGLRRVSGATPSGTRMVMRLIDNTPR